MRDRSGTAALGVALAALGIAAAVDAFRDERPAARGPATAPTATAREAATAAGLAQAGVEGVLFYTEASSCRLRAFRLPEVEATVAPEAEGCTFSVSPDGSRAGPARAVWRADGELYAVEIAGGVDVVSPTVGWARRFEGARAPAFKPNGALTFVRRGRLLEWTTACRTHVRSRTFREPRRTRRCARTIRTEAELTAATPEVPRPFGTRLALTEVAWVDDRRFAALVEAGAGEGLVVVAPDGVTRAWTIRRRLSRLETSPRLGYVSVEWGRDFLVFSRRGEAVELPEGVRSFAWSPDDRWLALAYRESVGFHSLRDPGLRLPFIPIAARDLGWR